MNPQRARAALDKLREHRTRTPATTNVADAVAIFQRDLARRFKSLGGIASAWNQTIPTKLADRAELISLTRGVLTVRVQDAPARFELDRFLRAGGERELQKRSPVTLKKVKLVG